MKQNIFFRAIVAIAMMLIGWLPSLAHDFEVNGVFYNVISTTEVAVIYKGYSYDSYSNEYSGDIVIPSWVNYNGTTYSVTSIRNYAFLECTSLTSIEIPNSVTSIGKRAFEDCSSLISIEIPNSVTSIGYDAFYGCTSLTSVVIGNSVTSIGGSAFSGCSSLTSIVVDAGNSKYDSRNGCNAIIETASNTLIAGCKNTIIPNSVTSIGGSAFSGCSSLTSIEIPNSVTSIGSSAFSDCESLTSVVWNVKKCSDFSSSSRPFENSPNITSFTLGDEVEHIPAYLCYNLSSLTSIVWNAKKCSDFCSSSRPFENSPNITSFTFGDEVEHIPAYLCYNLSSLTSIQIPNSVTSIGECAFRGCTGLTSVVWNAKKCSDFTYFDDGLFKDSKNITSFTFGDSVEHIPAYLCSGMSSLTSIKISNSVTSIGEWAFRGCTGLTSIEIPNGVTSIGDSAFEYCTGLTSIEIPNSVISIGEQAFSGCESLINIVVDNENIKYDSRNGCNAIIETASNTLIVGCQNTIIPNSVTSIGKRAFYGCTGLKSVKIPNKVTSIKESTFQGCSGLTSVVIGNSVTSIGDGAFCWCSSLTSVVWNAKKCSDFTSSENRPFFDSENITSFTFGDSVEHIPAYLCYGMSGLTNLEIPNSTTSIGESAFYNGEKLTILVLGNSVILIEKDAFKGCDNIKKIDSKATKAPTIENEDQFSENVYAKADLFVPTGYEDNYKYAYAWSEFYNIKGKDFSVKATSISLDKNEVSLKPTQTVALTETIQPYDTSNKKVIWSSSNESVATIDANGLVTAIAVGEAIITVTTTDGSNLSVTCKVTVVPTFVVSIEVTPNEVEAEENSEVQLSVIISPEDATYKSVEWSSSNDAIASVNANGLVKICKEGNVVITATTTDGSNLSATCRINVYSGIDGVNGDDVIVATVGDNIVVKNAKLGSVVNVYASNGALIASKEATDGSVVIEAPIKGIYVITIDGKSFKVMVK